MGLSSSYAGSINYGVNNQVKLRTTTVPFNTDVSGLAADAEFGKTNSKTVPVTTPSGTFNVTVTTGHLKLGKVLTILIMSINSLMKISI